MIYPENFENKIGFDRIRNMLAEKCLSPMGLEKTEAIEFIDDYNSLKLKLAATYEFQLLLLFEDYFPSEHYYKISDCLGKIRIEGTFPEVAEVFDLKRSLETVKEILNFFKNRDESKYPVLKSLCSSVRTFPYVLDSIDKIIDRHGVIKDNASSRLKEIRSELAGKSILVTKRLNAILRQAQSDGLVDSDTSASIRNGRGVIPVNVYDKRKIRGLIHDQSASGKTVYIEPEEIVEINNDIVELEYEERREIVRILTSFADNIRPYIGDLLESNAFLGEIDFIRAKSQLGNQLNAIKPVIVDKPSLSWKSAIHPLLYIAFSKSGRKVVPLDIVLDDKDRILLISGPNAGGKSVCLKTVGLLQYMMQCGITIPVGEGSEAGIFKNILIDIGDEQSIDNDLSTYSSHLINMKNFIRYGNEKSLILIDEFGTGTEPMLGGSIAEAILGELNRKHVFGVITTHYTNLKYFASLTDGIINGGMTFDNHLMQPLFQLTIGKPGSSFAFEIARKIGLPEDILSEAAEKAGVKNINYDKHLKDIARDKRYWETKRQNIRMEEKKLRELVEEFEKEISGTKTLKKEIIAKAKGDAENLLKESNRIIELTIRQIKESQADKEKTRDIRQQLQEFRENISEEPEPNVTGIEEKILKLHAKAKKIGNEKVVTEKPLPKPSPDGPLKPGDAVRMIDSMAAGEIVDIKGKRVQVETGSIRISVSIDKVEKISRAELKKSLRSSHSIPAADPEIISRKSNFKPEIDIRGVRGEEALNRVRDFIDDALIVQHRNLRILHGKGTGILRELVRQYLSSLNVVKTFRDEHVEFGGSGITVVEMDF